MLKKIELHGIELTSYSRKTSKRMLTRRMQMRFASIPTCLCMEAMAQFTSRILDTSTTNPVS